MLSRLCESCGTEFFFQPYRAASARFCSRHCRALWGGSQPNAGGRGKPKPAALGNKYRLGLRPTNAFAVGHRAWNKHVKGIHLSPASEFKRGRRSETRMAIGAVSVRVDRGGNPRAYVKIGQPNKWKRRAIKTWEDANGQSLPRGKVIHHDDRDTLNDALPNLFCLTRAEHLEMHRADVA